MNTHIIIRFDPKGKARVAVNAHPLVDRALAESLALTLLNRQLSVIGRAAVRKLRLAATVKLGENEHEYHFSAIHVD